MKHFITLFALAFALTASSQKTNKPLTKRIIVKTNVLNLVAGRPTFTIEKIFSNTFSTEISFVQGQINNFFFTDHYDYNGFLIRAKKHFTNLDYDKVSPYTALYIGNLNRTIETSGWVDNSGYFGYPSRDFSSNSIRGGASLGLSFITKNKIIIDASTSLGYGRYFTYHKPDMDFRGYIDMQIWLSIGYCF